MSVLIKGMEMPEHCGYCRFRYDGICHALQKTQYSMEDCPLVPDMMEDTGLEPEDVSIPSKYQQAEDEGLLVILQCRCRDCKFFPAGERDQKECGFGLEWPCEDDNPCPCKCDDGWYSIKPSPDFYCACGKRKEEDDE